jgi:CheY-like chemotaxis protein
MHTSLDCILLVDDNDSDNFLHRRVIERSGISRRVEIAENGREALELLDQRVKQGGGTVQQPDLILLDLNMPVMDGWEFLEQYQSLEGFNTWKVVIVILTTSINPADKVKAEKILGAGCFESKPLTVDLLRGIVARHFPGRS